MDLANPPEEEPTDHESLVMVRSTSCEMIDQLINCNRTSLLPFTVATLLWLSLQLVGRVGSPNHRNVNNDILAPAIKITGAITRLARFLCLSLLMTQVTPSADVKATKANVTSANVMFGKRSYHEKGDMQLESLTQSGTCFSNGCGGSSSYETAICNTGTYVYKITGFSGSNNANAVYATRFDIVCSDGYTATIGQAAAYNVIMTTIMSPSGYQAVLVQGGCIADHIQIGGTDFGNAGYGPLNTCSCAPGLTFVGFSNLQYQSNWPSFASVSIECDVVCTKGTYYSGGSCYSCPKGIL